MGVVKVGVLALDVVEMAKAKTQEVIQALSFERPDPRLGEGVGLRHHSRATDPLDASASKYLVKPECELCVTVVKDELRPKLLIIKPHHGISSLLLHPLLMRVVCARRKEDLPRAKMDKHEAVGQPHPDRRNYRLREKVTGHERVHVQPDEPAPSRFLGPAAPIW